jgi:hypothetical protein
MQVVGDSAYPDPTTGKTREYDFSAITADKLSKNFEMLCTHIIGECVNNSHPLVFFKAESPIQFLFYSEIKCAGIPLYFPDTKNTEEFVSMLDYFTFNKFHHYCSSTFSTQYCSFNKKKTGKEEEWMAWHDEEHHSVFNSLIGATKYEVDNWFSSWVMPENTEEEPIDINLYYPLLIVSGDIYECSQNKGRISLKKVNHVQFRKTTIVDNESETYPIDVITEPYLKKYLEVLENEQKILVSRIKRKKKQVLAAVTHIVSKAAEAAESGEIKSFRKVLEF